MIGLGSSSTLGIGLVVQLRDQFTQNANNISASLNKLTGNANKALGNTFGLMTKVGVGMTVAGVAITKGMTASVNSAMEFQKVLISVKALSGEINDTQMNALGEVAMKLGPKFGMSAIEIAKGMEELVKAGVNTKDIPMILEQMVMSAMGAGEALGGEGGVAARMTDIMMAFKIAPEEVGRMGDILSKATVESTINFNSLAESFKYSQDILKGFGFTLEESASMIAILGNVGIKGSSAGIYLANAWKELGIAIGGTSKKKNEALSALGISPKDLVDEFGSLRRPLEILQKVKDGVKGMGDVERSNVLFNLFGTRGSRGINPMLDLLVKGPSDKWSGKSLTDMIKGLTNESAGSNQRIFEEKRKSLSFQMAALKENWTNFMIVIGNSIKPMITRLVSLLNTLLEKLIQVGQSGFGKMLIKGIAILGAIIIPAGALLTIVSLIGRGLLGAVGAFASFRTAGLWALNALIGRTMAYSALQSGVGVGMAVNAAGSVYNTSTGRIVTTAATLGNLGGAAKGASGLLGMLGMALGRLIPIVGGIAMVLEVVNLLTENYVQDKSSDRRDVYTEDQYRNLLPQYRTTAGGTPTPVLTEADKNVARAEEIRRQVEGKDYKKGDTYINVHVDGKKTITKKINEGAENEANTAYGLNQ